MTASQRLSIDNLHLCHPEVQRPSYDRSCTSTGIVHLGLGAFARCHLATMTEQVLEHRHAKGQPLDWEIVGVSLRRPDQRNMMQPQDCLYTALERRPATLRARIIASVKSVLVASEDPEAVLALMASPATRIVTLTVTEKGYPRDAATGQLSLQHPDIAADIADPTRPTSALGYIVEALGRRRSAGLRPFTVVSCDNLQSNGSFLKSLVMTLAARRDPGLAAWIDTECRFPNSMVDRIVPAATDVDRADALAATGLADAAAISHEPFLQWVIEDDFVDGIRPEWELAGAELVSDVAPYERMKLRMLNAAHSALAYLGYLAGHETIGDAVSDQRFAGYCDRLWHDEIIPFVDGIEQSVLQRYAASLAERFANPAIRHRTWQIAMDGSLKLPLRILPTIEARCRKHLPSPCLTLATAAWMHYVGGVDERSRGIDVRDPLASRLRALADAGGADPVSRVTALLTVEEVFPRLLAADAGFRAALVEAYALLADQGAASAVAQFGRPNREI
jgi:fructuronate reductase